MVFDEKTQDYERGRLERVIRQIRQQIEKGRNAADRVRTNVVEVQKTMWDHINPTPRDLDDLANIWQYQTDIVREGNKAIFLSGRVRNLERLLKNPYFARIDFKEDGEASVEKIYMGISNLKDEETSEFLIFDWRAPVSSMFYDYEPGRAGYICPAGRIEGELLLKRQYRLWNGEIQFMFDSSIAIQDDILQEILARSADSKMKTIVTSIQREQNSIIRDDTHRLLVVHGPAGSGKTSIALHRAAYLLYRYRESITSDNIAIFSPNEIFSDYISDVLPELGEENINRTTFFEYARKTLNPKLQLEDASRQMEYLLGREMEKGDKKGDSPQLRGAGEEKEGDSPQLRGAGEEKEGDSPQLRGTGEEKEGDSPQLQGAGEEKEGDSPQLQRGGEYGEGSHFQSRVKGIRYKSSEAIIADLRQYALDVEESRRFEDVYFNGELIEGGEEISQYFRKELIFLPPVRRLEKVRSRLTAKLDLLIEKRIEEVVIELAKTGEYPNAGEIKGRSVFIVRGEAGPVRRKIEVMTTLDLLECYKSFLRYKDGQRAAGPKIEGDIDNTGADTCGMLHNNEIHYEDIGPLLLLDGLLSGFPKMDGIRHVIIDEIQDYTPIQLEVLKMLFQRCNMTLLGDPNQAINPFIHPCGIETITGILGADTSIFMELKKSYRSTRQIAEFCKNLIHGDEDTDYVNREGRLPEIICTANEDALFSKVAEDIQKLKGDGMKSIAVITRTEVECRKVYDRLSGLVELKLVTADGQEFFTGAAVVPSYLSKGLEFDAVLVLCMEPAIYEKREEVRLAYTVCTRALHRLHIYCPGGFPNFVKSLDRRLYNSNRE